MKFLLLIIFVIIISSCEFDYSLKDDNYNFEPKIVVNSVFSPNDNIDVYFGWSKQPHKKSYLPIPSGYIELYENGKQVAYATINEEGTAFLPYKPNAGKRYNFIAYINKYGTVKGESYIPLQGSAIGSIKKCHNLNNFKDKTICNINIDSIISVSKVRSVWLRLAGGYKFSDSYNDIYIRNNGNFLPDRIYSNNIYIDNFNIKIEKGDELFDGYAEIYGGISYYNRMIRIANDLLSLSFPLDLSMMFNSNNIARIYVAPEQWEKREIELTHISAEVIFPSDDYDKYIKNLYKQSYLSFDPPFPLFSEIVYVESNIENGLGIFAGYNSYFIDIKKRP